MKTYSVGDYANNPKGTMKELLQRWVPVGPRGGVVTPESEAGWRDSFYRFLHESLPEVEVAKETGGWHSRGDIALRWKPWGVSKIKHYVEVKSKLWTTTDLDRLTSQVERYFNDGGADRVYIVICGSGEETVREEFVRAVRTKYRYRIGVNVYWKKESKRGIEELA